MTSLSGYELELAAMLAGEPQDFLLSDLPPNVRGQDRRGPVQATTRKESGQLGPRAASSPPNHLDDLEKRVAHDQQRAKEESKGAQEPEKESFLDQPTPPGNPTNGSDTSNVQCPTCGRCFGSKRALKIHFLKHKKAKTLFVHLTKSALVQDDGDATPINVSSEMAALSHSSPLIVAQKNAITALKCQVCGHKFPSQVRFECHWKLRHKVLLSQDEEDKEEEEEPESTDVLTCKLCHKRFSGLVGLKAHKRNHKSYKLRQTVEVIDVPDGPVAIVEASKATELVKRSSKKKMKVKTAKVARLRGKTSKSTTSNTKLGGKVKIVLHRLPEEVVQEKLVSPSSRLPSTEPKVGQPFKCPLCSRQFYSKADLDKHIEEGICHESSDKSSGKTDNHSSDLPTKSSGKTDDHLPSSVAKPSFHCEHCGKGFYTEKSCTRHKYYNCMKAVPKTLGKRKRKPKLFFDEKLQTVANMSNTKPRVPKVQCDWCKHTFLNRANLGKHDKVCKKKISLSKAHAKGSSVFNKIFQCLNCYAKFSFLKTLKNHMRYKCRLRRLGKSDEHEANSASDAAKLESDVNLEKGNGRSSYSPPSLDVFIKGEVSLVDFPGVDQHNGISEQSTEDDHSTEVIMKEDLATEVLAKDLSTEDITIEDHATEIITKEEHITEVFVPDLLPLHCENEIISGNVHKETIFDPVTVSEFMVYGGDSSSEGIFS